MLGCTDGVPWLPYATMPLGGVVRLFADIKIFRAMDKKRESEEPQQKETGTNQMCFASISSLKEKRQQPETALATEN